MKTIVERRDEIENFLTEKEVITKQDLIDIQPKFDELYYLVNPYDSINQEFIKRIQNIIQEKLDPIAREEMLKDFRQSGVHY